MCQRIVKIFRDESATSMVEYALIISLLVGVVFTSVATLGNSVMNLMTLNNTIDVFYSRRALLPGKEDVLVEYTGGADTFRVVNEVSLTSSSPN